MNQGPKYEAPLGGLTAKQFADVRMGRSVAEDAMVQQQAGGIVAPHQDPVLTSIDEKLVETSEYLEQILVWAADTTGLQVLHGAVPEEASMSRIARIGYRVMVLNDKLERLLVHLRDV